MSEQKTILQVDAPRTRASLARDLQELGLEPGMTVIVHSSLSALGWVCGGPVAVIQALTDVLTPAGTLCMPAHSGEYSDPAQWHHPPVPADWWPVIRESMPLFDPRCTPTRGMGRIAETFRSWPETQRSSHPQVSFAAWGRHARTITANHGWDFPLGETSPLARIYDLDGSVLLLGAPYGNNTSFHLAEHRVPGRPPAANGAPALENGQKVWKVIQDVETDSDVFDALGADFEQAHPVRRGKVGSADCRLFRQRPAVDFAVAWLSSR
ncbi:MAG TPA: AAC(3) family N-acetyltransferase [Symbiobacteriaceae bacterium]|jgi:aminoglycoside 3-N-acetyltransferase